MLEAIKPYLIHSCPSDINILPVLEMLTIDAVRSWLSDAANLQHLPTRDIYLYGGLWTLLGVREDQGIKYISKDKDEALIVRDDYVKSVEGIIHDMNSEHGLRFIPCPILTMDIDRFNALAQSAWLRRKATEVDRVPRGECGPPAGLSGLQGHQWDQAMRRTCATQRCSRG